MTKHWTLAALLGASLAVGCTGNSTQEVAEEGAAAEVESGSGQEAAPAAQPSTPPASTSSTSTSRPAAQTPAAPQAPAARTVTIPAGTTVPLALLTPVSSETAKVEMPVRARVRQAVTVDGTTVLPAGTELVGEVTDAARAGRVQGRARVSIRFHTAEIGGSSERLAVAPVTFEADGTVGEDAAKVGLGAAAGAIVGGLLGGGGGAAKGAAIGGAAGTGAVLVTRGQEVELAEGAEFDATLAEAANLRVPR